MEKKHINYLVIVFICMLVGTVIIGSVKSYQTGRLCDSLRGQLVDATNTNRRLTNTITECRTIVDGLGQSTDRSIETARQAIELIEELRTQVQKLESCVYSDGTGYDYSDIDSMFGID